MLILMLVDRRVCGWRRIHDMYSTILSICLFWVGFDCEHARLVTPTSHHFHDDEFSYPLPATWSKQMSGLGN